MAVKLYRFGDFSLDCDRFELRRGERILKLERKPMELLILLAAKNGNLVSRAEIADCLWEREVFVDTEHGINTAVRKIRQALKDDSEHPRFVETVTGKGYRFIAPLDPDLLAGVAPGSVAGPILEPAEERDAVPLAQPRSVSSDKPAPIPRPARRWLWLAGVGAVAVCLPAVWSLSHRSTGTEQIQSLAVLPVENLTGDRGQEYVADGMTDELITMLARESTLKVTSRTSVMQYKSVHRPLPEMARELGVDSVLEGSLSRNGDRFHLTIQLIRASSDTHVWAQSYDRATTDMASLPNEAARAIAIRLDRAVPNRSVERYVSPEAHDAYLRGRSLWFADHTQEAGPFFARATELQPDYALGWSGLAIYYGASAVKGQLSPVQSLAEADTSAAKAIALDDTLPEAHLAAASAALVSHWDLKRADAEAQRAIELDPRFAEAYHLRSKILIAQDRHAEAIEVQRRATEIDPFTRPWAMTRALLDAREFDAALAEANERLVAYPNNTILLGLMHAIYEQKGMVTEAIETQVKAWTLNGRGAAALEMKRVFAQSGYEGVLRWELNAEREQARKTYVSPVLLAQLLAQLDDREGALAMLETAYRERTTGLLWLQCVPAFDKLHGDERYRLLVLKVGQPWK